MPDSVDLMARVESALDYPVAAGELEFNRYGFERLMDADTVGVVQPDATVVGGITEWLRVANAAAARDILITPHYNRDLHIHLLGAIENGLWAGCFYRESDVRAFDDVLEHSLEPDDDGMLEVPDRPGHGIELDRDSLGRFRI